MLVLVQDRKCVTFHRCKLIVNAVNICDALQDLVPFVHSKKYEKQPWRSVTFSKVAGFKLKLY